MKTAYQKPLFKVIAIKNESLLAGMSIVEGNATESTVLAPVYQGGLLDDEE